jgi:hypothetical protein
MVINVGKRCKWFLGFLDIKVVGVMVGYLAQALMGESLVDVSTKPLIAFSCLAVCALHLRLS